jgi:DNA repair protein RecN (Recombination protein N)
MLKTVRIFNIILIEAVELSFHSGLNVITGETGSGKSAIMHALSLVVGGRADVSAVRHGADKGAIEALFDISKLPKLLEMLIAAGIDHDRESELIIRREIYASGKSRAFVNNQAVQLTLLKQIGELLIAIVGQHANRSLLSIERHRHLLDLYGGLEGQVYAFGRSWAEEQRLRAQLHETVKREAQELRERDMFLRELEEIDEASLKDEEDEDLFAEYSRLTHSEELAQKTTSLLQALSSDRNAIVTQLLRHKGALESLVAIDPSLQEMLTSYSAATIELQEIAYSLSAYKGRIECNPHRSQQLNERLQLIATLKRKYGATIGDILTYREQIAGKLARLDSREEELTALRERLGDIARENDRQSSTLTAARQAAACHFSAAISSQLAALNMAKATFHVAVTAQTRSSSGNDGVEFFLTPNVGESQIALRESASGGELSRILLALHAELAGREQIATLIFDEIDANIGGETAAIIGQKLRKVSESHQLLCITHFPQVAKQAELHLQISKAEISGRTLSHVKTLDNAGRRRELARMVGG